MKAVITVVGQDKTGIVAKVATTLSDLAINIEDISQTIMDGFFTMTMLVVIPEGLEFSGVKSDLETLGDSLGVKISIQNEALFSAMHNI
jgi:ACT domain-containing protein